MEKTFYNHQEIEKKWKQRWDEQKLYEVDVNNPGEKFYALDMFPYPSAYNLHVGHWRGYVLSDYYARYQMLHGKNVLHPMGFDAFGLNAENAAIKYKSHPLKFTQESIENMLRQFKEMGTSIDWSKYLSTCDPEYYKWTQWLFLQLFKHGLAEKRKSLVNWCPNDQTVLANEQVIGGCCERCGATVTKKELSQWFLKTTEFAQELLDGLQDVTWPERTKTLQREWIGKSEGAMVSFATEAGDVEVFTTRVDTIYGVTSLVLAPEHPLVEKLTTSEHKQEVANYVIEVKSKTDVTRQQGKEKTAVFTGATAKNPITGEDVPVWIADYVLMTYGTGAVMSVPAHDERDNEFAKKYNLPIKTVIIPRLIDEKNPHRADKEVTRRNIILGIVRDPKTGKFLSLKWKKLPWTTFITGGIEEDETPEQAARREITEETGYKNLKLVKVTDTPVQDEFFAAHKDTNRVVWCWWVLFDLENDERTEIDKEESDSYNTAWVEEKELTRDTFTHTELPFVVEWMNNREKMFSDNGILFDSGEFTKVSSEEAKEKIAAKLVELNKGKAVTTYRLRDWLVSRQRYWGAPIPIVYDPDGLPHAVKEEHLPLLLPEDVDFLPGGESPIARSAEYTKRAEELYGKGWHFETDTLDTFVDSSWYFLRYLTPKDTDQAFDKNLIKKWLPVDLYVGGIEHATLHLLYARFIVRFLAKYGYIDATMTEPFKELFNIGTINLHGSKMSKSKGNVVSPDLLIEHYGTDALRGYQYFIGPMDVEAEWNNHGINGIHRFILKIFKMFMDYQVPEAADTKIDDEFYLYLTKLEAMVKEFKLNTAISEAMKFVSVIEKAQVSQETMEKFLITLSPIFPFMAEELWEKLGHKESIFKATWPGVKDVKTTPKVNIMVNQKFVVTLEIAATDPKEIEETARADNVIAQKLSGKEIVRVITVPGKMVNFITQP